MKMNIRLYLIKVKNQIIEIGTKTAIKLNHNYINNYTKYKCNKLFN